MSQNNIIGIFDRVRLMGENAFIKYQLQFGVKGCGICD
jgi:hypothetical protein